MWNTRKWLGDHEPLNSLTRTATENWYKDTHFQVIEKAINGRNKAGDELRNEVGMEWEISVWMDWEILRKWAKMARSPLGAISQADI